MSLHIVYNTKRNAEAGLNRGGEMVLNRVSDNLKFTRRKIQN